ncbi:carboxypeptidase-like regulatory domain-containing protein [Flavobacterium luminosum]|uniref:Carboxypeptidase-like regulatory domain-containing protein n=1 Tax=Flavobacterium luminosum TaxID=2949086 RepID=A0ABT0TN68_9FLAO|nr:carboxypeptidase-like regulatory domain-containing protein [Flavobacterium sp. HXWNR70]MCL9808825.1 carboxypeptidase-like regulatory domain-containing protein [Flavobacterium sp. HXWNR70]
MRYFTVFLLYLFSTTVFAQENTVKGVIVNDNNFLPIWNANIVNTSKVRGAISDANGNFEINAEVNDVLLISCLGYQSIEVRVTNDWIKNRTSRIKLTEKAYALEEIVIPPYTLTGYLEVDSKLIPERENYWYSIAGLTKRYEGGENSPNAFSRVMGSLFNPADALYNFFGKKPKELKKLRELKKDDNLRNILQTRYDRQTIYAMLGINEKELIEILERCNYSESFMKSANDLQILDAVSGCYEEYKILKKN